VCVAAVASWRRAAMASRSAAFTASGPPVVEGGQSCGQRRWGRNAGGSGKCEEMWIGTSPSPEVDQCRGRGDPPNIIQSDVTLRPPTASNKHGYREAVGNAFPAWRRPYLLPTHQPTPPPRPAPNPGSWPQPPRRVQRGGHLPSQLGDYGGETNPPGNFLGGQLGK